MLYSLPRVTVKSWLPSVFKQGLSLTNCAVSRIPTARSAFPPENLERGLALQSTYSTGRSRQALQSSKAFSLNLPSSVLQMWTFKVHSTVDPKVWLENV